MLTTADRNAIRLNMAVSWVQSGPPRALHLQKDCVRSKKFFRPESGLVLRPHHHPRSPTPLTAQYRVPFCRALALAAQAALKRSEMREQPGAICAHRPLVSPTLTPLVNTCGPPKKLATSVGTLSPRSSLDQLDYRGRPTERNLMA